MANFLSNIQARVERVALYRARAEARRQLLLMSDHNLEDIGISRELLESGVKAWPWQAPVEQAGESALTATDYDRAIRGLRAGSNRNHDESGTAIGGQLAF